MLQVSRQALYRTPTPRTAAAAAAGHAIRSSRRSSRSRNANQTDGYRMVCALRPPQGSGVAVNRKRVLRVMRERKLIQRRRPLEPAQAARLLPGRAARQLWQLDMTSIWVAEHGWTYLNAIIDCCTREIVGWQLELRCRADEAIAVVDQAAAAHGIQPGELDARHATTARPSPPAASAHGSPSSGSATAAAATATPSRQAFIESWFGKLKEREVWLNEYETLDDARRGDRRLRRPLPPPAPLAASTTGRRSRSRQTWEDHKLQKHAA